MCRVFSPQSLFFTFIFLFTIASVFTSPCYLTPISALSSDVQSPQVSLGHNLSTICVTPTPLGCVHTQSPPLSKYVRIHRELTTVPRTEDDTKMSKTSVLGGGRGHTGFLFYGQICHLLLDCEFRKETVFQSLITITWSISRRSKSGCLYTTT